MQALLREYNGEQFVYVPVTYKKGYFYGPKGECFSTWQVLDIFRDNRKNYVTCSNCGEMIKNTPESIEAHKEKHAKNKNCLTCKHAKEGYSGDLIKKSYVPDPNKPGNYIVTTKRSTYLVCNHSYWDYQINTEEADRHCMYYGCRNATYEPIDDFYLRYPHAFDVMPTVDILRRKRWKVRNDGSADHVFFIHPTMKSLTACVNRKGIIEYFEVQEPNRYTYYGMYSHKYSQFFWWRGEGWRNARPGNLSEVKYEEAIKHIKELF